MALAIFSIPSVSADWRTATRESAKIAPLPSDHNEAVVHVYAARAVSWRGYFAVHTWIATKEKGASQYITYHVIGWRLKRNLSVVAIEPDIPDRHWFGAKPRLIHEIIGVTAESAIPKIKQAALEYPYPNAYRAWPGPNSNTFVSFILRRVPELGVELPPHAIGRDWINRADFAGYSETGTGIQLSLFGLFGLTLGVADGIEINVLGLNFGFDLFRPALKLPLVGRIGMRDGPVGRDLAADDGDEQRSHWFDSFDRFSPPK